MKTSLLDLNQAVKKGNTDTVINAVLSFRPFIDFLQQKTEQEHTAKTAIYQMVLDKFAAYPELLEPIAPENAAQYKDILEQIYTILTPALASENNYLWALAMPMRPVVFYTTNAFYELLTEEGCEGEGCSLRPNMLQQTDEDWKNRKRMHLYSLVLDKLYGISFNQADMVHKTLDDGTGLARYYRLDFDDRFINIKASTPLPELTLESLHDQLPGTQDPINMLEKVLPLHMFTFEGMSVITLTDVTAEYAVGTLKDIVVQHTAHAAVESFIRIEMALRSIAGNPDVHFGLLPLLRVNNRFVYKQGTGLKSLLIDLAQKNGLEEEMFHTYVESYIQTPRVLFLRSITPLHRDLSPALKMLSDNGVRSFVVLPLYYQGKLAGVLEVYSDKPNTINEKMLSLLNAASLTLSQLLQQSIDDLKTDVTRVINDKFTPLQPAVQWKFNEAAWQYLHQEEETDSPQLPRIAFEDVYPMYGAVDIRNSTEERNNALKADLETHIQLLVSTLKALRDLDALPPNEEMKRKANDWKLKLDNNITMSPYQAMRTEDYLHREVTATLKQVKQDHPRAAGVVDNYLRALDEKTGITYQKRRELETSMQMINSMVGKALDGFNNELQSNFPCYFEKFRTDGVEYDIYVGQSIAPSSLFGAECLTHIRQRQLEVMAQLTQRTKALIPLMPRALQTTQLIFVHGAQIDISFRPDEKRFDVEGSYNIRYQVIKKRIDKAYIKDTAQRLTQPGTIAIVYSGQSEVTDYLNAIKHLQREGVLAQETEWLELEELQGLSGLKALRVKVLGGAA